MPWRIAIYFTGGSWRWRNIQLRLIGLGFSLIGFLHLVGGIYLFAIEVRTPQQGSSPATNLIFVCSGLTSLAIGRWLLRRPAYRPDLGDVHPLLGKAGGYTADYIAELKRTPRRWWTGDPLPVELRGRDG